MKHNTDVNVHEGAQHTDALLEKSHTYTHTRNHVGEQIYCSHKFKK